MKVIIIGSGIAGLASAVRMAARGYTVEVFEANAYPGGKITTFEKNGYRFDAGPSLLTLPGLLDDIFIAAGKNPKDYFNYRKKNICANYFYEDGTFIKAFSEREKFIQEFEEKTGVEGKIIEDYLNHAEKLYELAGKIFLEKSLHKRKTWLSKEVVKAFSHIRSFDVNTTMHKANIKRLKHPKLIQYFNRYATYNGSNPYAAPGILNMIPHLEHNEGTFFPEKGMYAITQSLYQLTLDLNVKFNFNKKVSKINVEKGKANGVFMNEEFYPADAVICNMDIVPAFRNLLSEQKQPEKILKQERSSSALIFYWGIKKAFAQLDLHNIFFAANAEEEFNALFKRKQIADDPTVYIHISSKEKKDDAPPGCENWFVMVNAPANEGQDWDKIIAETKMNIMHKLNRMLDIDLEKLIETEEILDPRLIESRTSSFQGSLYGTSSNSKMAAFLRHPNFSNRIKNLYFCGGSVHPGGGIPLCLLSAKIVDDLMHE